MSLASAKGYPFVNSASAKIERNSFIVLDQFI